jgi:hypothetical protein
MAAAAVAKAVAMNTTEDDYLLSEAGCRAL